MFISEAYAQAAQGAAPAGVFDQIMASGLPMLAMIFVVFYFLLIRPQQQARKRHMETVAALKKGDVVVTSGGLIGKVKSVADDELRLELSPNVEVRVIRSAIGEVRSKTEPAPANDSKPGAA
jgi:preprotein translocase subunit YajC